MGVTIKDVAREAGVSPSTVSRVIANNPRISPATTEKVREAMKQLGYYPNAIARSLVKQQAHAIGIVMTRSTDLAMTNPFFPEVIRGISSIAQEAHYHLVLAEGRTLQEEREMILQMLRNRRADGAVLLSSRLGDSLIDDMEANGFPYVVVGRVPGRDQVLSVNNDNVEAAYIAVKHLIQLGRRSIAFIGGMGELVVTQDRLTGYRQALAEAGLEEKPEWVKYTDFSLEGGQETAVELLLDRRVDAVFAMDDILATGALRAARQLGIEVPDDLSIVGFNDNPIARCLDPQLTTVRIPIYELGKVATQMLLKAVKGEPVEPRQVILPAVLVIRESCGAGSHHELLRKQA